MIEPVVDRQSGRDTRGLPAADPSSRSSAAAGVDVVRDVAPVARAFDAVEDAAPVTRVCTALFTDLRGFSALAERLADDPMRLLEVVNEHLTTVARAVTRCGGTVEKFVGDGVFATFGAHTAMPAHRERGLAAALAVVGANEALNRRRSTNWGFRLDVGVGAAAGKVVVGVIGDEHRSEVGVLGDPVNIASRLSGQAQAGEVLLAASVYSEVASSVRGELLGLSPIRGRSGEVELYRLKLLPDPSP